MDLMHVMLGEIVFGFLKTMVKDQLLMLHLRSECIVLFTTRVRGPNYFNDVDRR